MRILSVIPMQNGNPHDVTITTVKDGKTILFVYSGVTELLHDPNNPGNWCDWNGGTLTDALQWIINLPGSVGPIDHTNDY